MPSYEYGRRSREVDEVIEEANRPTLFWLHRPMWIHRRGDNGKHCLCGCGSTVAWAFDERQHIDLLVDTFDGTRVLRADAAKDPGTLADWETLAKEAVRLDVPLRCSEAQAEFHWDLVHKVLIGAGGERGGKTQWLGEWSADGMFLLGGPGARFLWVAPTQDDTQTAVDKLVRGYQSDRWNPPIIPKEFIAHAPRTKREDDQAIRLVDGSALDLKHAAGDGTNIAGRAYRRVAVDEFEKIRDQRNWDTALGRVLDTGGQVGGASTPVVGSWAKRKIIDVGVSYQRAREIEARGGKVVTIVQRFTCFDNPWQSEENIRDTILAKAGTTDYEDALKHPAVRREVFGEHVGDQPFCWPHYTPERHDLHGVADLRAWGYRNVTRIAFRSFFRGTNCPLDRAGGQDFNVGGMSTLIGHICTLLDEEEIENPKKWHLIITDEVFEPGDTFDQGQRIIEAGYPNLAISCDPTGAMPNQPAAQGHYTQTASTPAEILDQAGHDCRACHWSANGNPSHPAKRDMVNVVNALFRMDRARVHERCTNLRRVLVSQLRKPDGTPYKPTGSKADRESGVTDALTYFAWPVFSDELVPILKAV